eukprot:3938985-Rhodomonas_salina.3
MRTMQGALQLTSLVTPGLWRHRHCFCGCVAARRRNFAADCVEGNRSIDRLVHGIVAYDDGTSASGVVLRVVGEARFARLGTIACKGSLVDISTFAIGDTISITVVDPDLDQYSAGADMTGTGQAGDRLRLKPAVAAMQDQVGLPDNVLAVLST